VLLENTPLLKKVLYNVLKCDLSYLIRLKNEKGLIKFITFGISASERGFR